MNTELWLLGLALLLLFMAISPEEHRKLPFSNASVYLALGVLLSPAGFNLLSFDLHANFGLVEMVTKFAVILSLLIDGLKMNTPFSDKAWRNPLLLGGPVMIVTIFAVAGLAHYALSLSWGSAILLGAVLAPTDPVLASTISLRDADDDHDARFSLTGEAGFNDGTAFPFVILGLDLMLGQDTYNWLGLWFLHRIVWGIPVGLLVGYLVGYHLSLIGMKIRERWEHHCAPNDFLALGLVVLAYSVAELLGGWGFLAAFTSGIGMRRAAHQLSPHGPTPETAGETNTSGRVISDVFKFGDTAERVLEFTIIFFLGTVLHAEWTVEALWIALPLFFVIRPLTVLLFRLDVSKAHRVVISWFGIKGIGSLYYLAFALGHAELPGQTLLSALTVSTVCLSIIFHTLTVNPTVFGLIKNSTAGAE